jgi:hypothetical protein
VPPHGTLAFEVEVRERSPSSHTVRFDRRHGNCAAVHGVFDGEITAVTGASAGR